MHAIFIIGSAHWVRDDDRVSRVARCWISTGSYQCSVESDWAPGQSRETMLRSLPFLASITRHRELATVRRWLLNTDDAHEVYRCAGWPTVASPQRLMERVRQPQKGQ
ncbi:hypothetical protein EH228_16445 [Erwinia endophytica]|uniref:hypothetical protein n=1 Tax=Erwinia endophytica TaxID=1563158 RepID=UPI001265E9EA|nr:hypothetical protein [Erwinia endophytica]KAB8307558.1 hypothetical protein EH228_16445 [Erwinia endophytica]